MGLRKFEIGGRQTREEVLFSHFPKIDTPTHQLFRNPRVSDATRQMGTTPQDTRLHDPS